MIYTRDYYIQELIKISNCTYDELDGLTIYQLANMYDRIIKYELAQDLDLNKDLEVNQDQGQDQAEDLDDELEEDELEL